MGRLLLLVAIILAVWWLTRAPRSKGTSGSASKTLPERMVRCAHCGVYLPQSEALGAGDKYYCNEEHRRLAQ